jgi:hypothetical protein
MSDPTKMEEADTVARSGDLAAFKAAIDGRDPLDVVTYRYPHGETYLHWAATAENGVDLIEYLVDDLGALVNINNWYGATPLYYACSKGRKENIDALLERGADTREISTFSGYSCVDMAHSIDPDLLDSTNLRKKHTYILDALQQSAYFEYNYRQILSWRLAYWQRCAPNKSTVQTIVPPESEEMSDNDLFLRCVEDEIMLSTNLSTDDPAAIACLGCGKENGLKRCQRCKRARFCSPECNEKTWHVHRHMCDPEPERRPFHTKSYISMQGMSNLF